MPEMSEKDFAELSKNRAQRAKQKKRDLNKRIWTKLMLIKAIKAGVKVEKKEVESYISKLQAAAASVAE